MGMSKPARVRAGMAGGTFARAAPTLSGCAQSFGLASSSSPLPSAISLYVCPLSPHFVVSLVRFVSPFSG